MSLTNNMGRICADKIESPKDMIFEHIEEILHFWRVWNTSVVS